MRLFDRLLNPAWHRVGALSEQGQFEIAVLVMLHGGLRRILRVQLVDPIEKLFDPKVPLSIRESSFGELLREGRQLIPLTPAMHDRLVDEAELAFLRCSQGKPVGNIAFRIMNTSVIIDGVGVIALAEIKTRTAKSLPDVLEAVGYSRDPDECRVQLAIALTSELGLKKPEWPSFLAGLLEGPWKLACDHGLQGIATGVSRVPRDVLMSRAREECNALNAQAKGAVMYLAESIAKKVGGSR